MQTPINREFIESLVREKRGMGAVAMRLNYRFWDEREDVLQEALLKLWEKRANIRNPGVAGAFFYGLVQNVARAYRDRKIDRADYCEVQDWMARCSSPEEAESEVERRDREIREAHERLEELLERVPLRHRIAYWRWRDRGYVCRTATEWRHVELMRQALARAARSDR